METNFTHPALRQLESYDVRFSGLGNSDRASFPLGNGELCANAWLAADGFHFYLSRSDALTELDRTVKLGEFVVNIDPNPFSPNASVEQHLSLKDGLLAIKVSFLDKDLNLNFCIDTESQDAYVNLESNFDMDVRVRVNVWRTASNPYKKSFGMFWGDEDLSRIPEISEVSESADLQNLVGGQIVTYHHNKRSIVPGVARLHGLTEVLDSVPDQLTGRIFGSLVSLQADVVEDLGNSIQLRNTREACIRFATFSGQGISLQDLVASLPSERSFNDVRLSVQQFWQNYWLRSWIFIEGDEVIAGELSDDVFQSAELNRLPKVNSDAPSKITQAYVLTKWMMYCGLRGKFPMLYNGALFTTMPGAGMHLDLENFGKAFTAEGGASPSLEINPDERSWTLEHLWQNLRLPYYSVLGRGEQECLKPLFRYFRSFWDLNRARARIHYGSKGQWSTEMTLSCGLQSPGIYGVDRDALAPGHSKNRWGGSINLSPGLELVKLMYDYWRFTKDENFLREEAIPYALDLMDFAYSRYFDPVSGRIAFTNLNSLETYFDTTNPIAVVAGFKLLADELLSTPELLESRRGEVEQFRELLPHIPSKTEDGETYLLPAEVFEEERQNVESPEFYPIYPFDLTEEIGLDVAVNTWTKVNHKSGALRPRTIGEHLAKPCFAGWQYHGPVSANLGLLDECFSILQANVAISNPGYAFPAMWGPVYDSVPDVDHGANILNTLQGLVAKIHQKPDLKRLLPSGLRVNYKIYDANGNSIQGDLTT